MWKSYQKAMEKHCYSGILSLNAEYLYYLLKLLPSPLPHTYTHKCTHIQAQTNTQTLWVKLLLLLLLSRFSHVRLCARPHRRQPTRLPCPWDSPGKNTGVGCHFLLQCMKVKSESEVAQLCPTLSDTMDCSLPGSSVHGIFQARVLE